MATALTPTNTPLQRRRRLFNLARGVHRVALLDRLLDHPPHQHRRLGLAAGAMGFDGAHQNRFERRLVFFEVERDLLVRHLVTQRTHQEPANRGDHANREHRSRSDDRGRAIARPFEAVGGNQDQADHDADHPDGAPDRQLHPPARAHLADDRHDVGRRSGAASKEVDHNASEYARNVALG